MGRVGMVKCTYEFTKENAIATFNLMIVSWWFIDILPLLHDFIAIKWQELPNSWVYFSTLEQLLDFHLEDKVKLPGEGGVMSEHQYQFGGFTISDVRKRAGDHHNKGTTIRIRKFFNNEERRGSKRRKSWLDIGDKERMEEEKRGRKSQGKSRGNEGREQVSQRSCVLHFLSLRLCIRRLE